MVHYSVAEAQEQLPAIVDAAAAGEDVRLTRHGLAVVVLVPVAQYERLKAGRMSFREAYAIYRAEFPEGEYSDEDGPEIGPEFWDSLRDRSPGREINL